LSSSSPGATPDRDSKEDYLEIGGNAYWNPTIEARHVSMVGTARGDSQNSSSRYPTIRGSKSFDAQTPNNKVVWNLNPYFNVVRLQTIMELIQWMVLQDSPLVALDQQGVEVTGHIVAAERSIETQQDEPSFGNRSTDQAKCA
jgi:hypothetical protein